MDNRRGLPDDMREENMSGMPRNGLNGGEHRNHNMPLARQMIDTAEAQRLRSGFTHRMAPTSTKIEDHSEEPKFHDSGEIGKAPNKWSDGENAYR